MRERIIVASDLNESEILRSLAKRGTNTINLRVMNPGEFARTALIKCGKNLDGDLIGTDEEVSIIIDSLRDNSYFKNVSYSDAQNLQYSLQLMRMLVIDNPENEGIKNSLSKGPFEKKNAAILDVYQSYMETCENQKMLDSISVIRKAIDFCHISDSEVIVLDEYPLTPLELHLISSVTSNQYRKCNLLELYGILEKEPNMLKTYNCYGFSNEVEHALTQIYLNDKLDQTTVAVSDSRVYNQIFYDCSVKYDIPMTFEQGVRITNSNPAQLLSLYLHWMTDGHFGEDSLRQIIYSSVFNKTKFFADVPDMDSIKKSELYKAMYGLRLTNDAKINSERLLKYNGPLKKCLEYIAHEFELPTEEFIVKYAYIRKDMKMHIDFVAAKKISMDFATWRKNPCERTLEEVIESVLDSYICMEISKAGYLHISSIKGAIQSIRDNLYILGMSANMYPGTPRENYIFLDKDMQFFSTDYSNYTSEGILRNKIQNYHNLLRLATSLDSKTVISFAGIDTGSLKINNPSSLIYENPVEKVGYFDNRLSNDGAFGKAYNNNDKIVIFKESNEAEKKVDKSLEQSYSPSALNLFFDCRWAFMLKYIIGIPEPEEKSLFDIFPASDKGTLAHSLMEELANNNITKNDFLTMAGNAFDNYMVENPPIIANKLEQLREEFIDMMQNAYDMDSKREVLLKEEDIACEHETGVKIHGFPDRVEKLGDDSCVIIDYKTGQTVKHKTDDINSCLQIVIYAYLMEKSGYKVDHGEFLYINADTVVTCKYDDDIKNQLSMKLTDLKEAIEKHDFFEIKPKEEIEHCRYCKYTDICCKNKEGEAEE